MVASAAAMVVELPLVTMPTPNVRLVPAMKETVWVELGVKRHEYAALAPVVIVRVVVPSLMFWVEVVVPETSAPSNAGAE